MDKMSDARTLGGGAEAREKWSLAEGATLGGYRVVKPLGRGGMEEVYAFGFGAEAVCDRR